MGSSLKAEVDEKSLQRFVSSFENSVELHVKSAMDDIRVEWGYEISRQQLKGSHGDWKPLSQRYATRKAKEYRGGKDGVKYNSILRRTGTMLQGYKDGIQLDQTNFEVSMPYPNERARIHQSASYAHQRAFDFEIFQQIAVDKFREAFRKSLT